MESLIQRIKEIAAANALGFTITLPDCEYVTSGYVVAMLETQNSFGDEGLRRVIEMASDTTGIMGGWNNDGLFYWDAVYIIQDRKRAIELGKANEQIAIYHIENDDVILI
ncbi:hypothetical protein SAMN04487996_110238 [Dyadobacter soli]|uniref:Uncharacterized protein n=1 Tax=Dyadobacter soli TaxID=659014 RepID=A0A1G7KW04_9BACT|nr:hypothetical protein [Dyadobacter soli]SDF41403.1 hypothetical protein SAMN04487996_110238 [Dyadobacter soli]